MQQCEGCYPSHPSDVFVCSNCFGDLLLFFKIRAISIALRVFSVLEGDGLLINLVYQQHHFFEAFQLYRWMAARYALKLDDLCSRGRDFTFPSVDVI